MGKSQRPQGLAAMLELTLDRAHGRGSGSAGARVLVLAACAADDQEPRMLADRAAMGIASAGGDPVRLDIASESSPAQVTWRLPREMSSLALQVERLVKKWNVDGLLLVPGDEASLVAMLRGAARVGLPCLVSPAGGGPWDPAWRTVLRVGAKVERGRVSLDQWLNGLEKKLGDPAFSGAWRFPSQFKLLLESLSLCLQGAASQERGAPAAGSFAHRTGETMVELCHKRSGMAQSLTQSAFRNAFAMNAALGGDPVAAWMLLQVAGEMGAPLKDSWLFPEGSLDYIGIEPGNRSMTAMNLSGGLASLMLMMFDQGSIDGSARTANRRKLKEALGDVAVPKKPAFFKQAAGQRLTRRDWLVKGDIAPSGMIINGPQTGSSVAFPVKVLRGEAEALEWIRQNRARSDEIMILKAPGERLPLVQAAVEAAKLECWLLTDGVPDAANNGRTGFRLPATPGSWGQLKDGDMVKIDLKEGQVARAVPGLEILPEPSRPDADSVLEADWDRLKSFIFS